MTTYEAMKKHGCLCEECQHNAKLLADWLSQPGEPVSPDVVLGMAYAIATNNAQSLHDSLAQGVRTAQQYPRIIHL